MKTDHNWYLVLCIKCATIGSGMASLSSLTPAQCLEIDAACHEVASRWGFGRVSVVIEKGKPRWIEIAGTRGIGALERKAVEVASERPPPGSQ
jgi:hypothetical protein